MTNFNFDPKQLFSAKKEVTQNVKRGSTGGGRTKKEQPKCSFYLHEAKSRKSGVASKTVVVKTNAFQEETKNFGFSFVISPNADGQNLVLLMVEERTPENSLNKAKYKNGAIQELGTAWANGAFTNLLKDTYQGAKAFDAIRQEVEGTTFFVIVPNNEVVIETATEEVAEVKTNNVSAMEALAIATNVETPDDDDDDDDLDLGFDDDEDETEVEDEL